MSGKMYSGVVVYFDADTEETGRIERAFATQEGAEHWVLRTMMKAVKEHPGIEEVEGDWESPGGLGKTFRMSVGL